MSCPEDDPSWDAAEEDWFQTTPAERRRREAQQRAAAVAAAELQRRATEEAEAEAARQAEETRRVEREQRARDDLPRRVKEVLVAIVDSLQETRREGRDTARLAAQTPANLAEAQLSLLHRCPACRLPIVVIDEAQDEAGNRWHARCRVGRG